MLKIFTALQLRVMDLRDRQEGQTFAEYGLILALIAIVVAVAATALGLKLGVKFDTVTTKLGA
jgi:pilus assembly protein Flp/PilA